MSPFLNCSIANLTENVPAVLRQPVKSVDLTPKLLNKENCVSALSVLASNGYDAFQWNKNKLFRFDIAAQTFLNCSSCSEEEKTSYPHHRY